jgi:hypothetical protein
MGPGWTVLPAGAWSAIVTPCRRDAAQEAGSAEVGRILAESGINSGRSADMRSSVGHGARPDGALMRKLNGSGEKSARRHPPGGTSGSIGSCQSRSIVSGRFVAARCHRVRRGCVRSVRSAADGVRPRTLGGFRRSGAHRRVRTIAPFRDSLGIRRHWPGYPFESADNARLGLDLHRQHGTSRSVLSLVSNPLPALSIRSFPRELITPDVGTRQITPQA